MLAPLEPASVMVKKDDREESEVASAQMKEQS